MSKVEISTINSLDFAYNKISIKSIIYAWWNAKSQKLNEAEEKLKIYQQKNPYNLNLSLFDKVPWHKLICEPTIHVCVES